MFSSFSVSITCEGNQREWYSASVEMFLRLNRDQLYATSVQGNLGNIEKCNLIQRCSANWTTKAVAKSVSWVVVYIYIVNGNVGALGILRIILAFTLNNLYINYMIIIIIIYIFIHLYIYIYIYIYILKKGGSWNINKVS